MFARVSLSIVLLLTQNVIAGGPHPSRIFSSERIPPDTLITLERTICFGRCPSYKVTIDAEGIVVFEGREYVSRKGKVRDKISPSKLEPLVQQFREIGYFDLDDSYAGGNKACVENWTDNPTAITSIRIDGKFKSVSHYHGCRGAKILEKLTELENKIDEVAGTSRWTS